MLCIWQILAALVRILLQSCFHLLITLRANVFRNSINQMIACFSFSRIYLKNSFSQIDVFANTVS